MVATLFTYAGPNYVAILKHLGMDAEADAAQAEIDKMKANIMESAWDGDWFLRAYDANGEKMGSKEVRGRSDLHRATGIRYHVRHR
jgi:cellobiose phosphorylase (EC 2.4.1.20)